MKINRILVPVNGDVTDREAIGLACRMAKPVKGKIFAIYVIEVKRTLPLDAEIAQEIEKGERVLGEAGLVAEQLGYEIDAEMLQARDVGPAIVDEAVERVADLIIMGIAHKKRFGESSLGRTVPYVLRSAPCRVWVMKEPLTP